jgi:signal transduction histidine kinase
MGGFEDFWGRVFTWLPQLLLGLVIMLVFLGLAMWLVNWQLGGEFSEKRDLTTLNAVMAATVLRRDRRQTVGRLFEAAAEGLGAVSGCVHLRAETGQLELVAMLKVSRLDQLTGLPAMTSLMLDARAGPVVAEVMRYSDFWALDDGESRSLCAVTLGRSESRGLLVLCWPWRKQAERWERVMRQISWYADQVLAEYDGLDERARLVQSLNDALRWRDWLTRTAAHDMGNRLSGPLHLLAALEGPAGEVDPALLAEARQQLGLLEGMLDEFADPDRRLEMAPVSIEGLVSLAAAMMQIQDGPFTVDVPAGLPPLWGERQAILRVLDNLLRNALRYNRAVPGLRVWLRVRPAESGWVLFEVGDSGQGIAPEAQAHLFEFGVRSAESAKVQGHGLGLWSCRRLVRAHGGQIWVESNPGLGTRFFFTLPTAPPQPVPAADA